MELTAQEVAIQGNAMVGFFNQKFAEAMAEIARLNGAVAILEHRLAEATKLPTSEPAPE